ncbi:hypothetical protein MRB53_001123 [Persea americana]|uniref:Uncharacterized protein n=1 Tax=Persea americana TaxID=3435 RepID=A0ACC2MQU4_PERAE|nr:hypothetical protein MRB53_001123 [Persea americana]|eukprot:TRINITY_DN2283_c0_g2_i1.p2 TRINITY_DN2283_c0_g2~~TRINITY_DN2283_c0_g2_i1.p2  ORF type:complete len:185 (-),score=40.49 TRINITY_DN2283_c0_g2_i1:463-1017(-)
MELSVPPRFLSNFPHHYNTSFNPNSSFPLVFSPNSKTTTTLTSLTRSGLIYFAVPLPRATTSEETSTSTSERFDNVHDEEINSEETSFDARTQVMKLLDKLNVELGSIDPYPVLVYGSSALAALWISSAIVGAIDSIPLVPKVLEVVGLGFTVWFSYRYLIFKKNREELLAKFEEIKQEIIGSE